MQVINQKKYAILAGNNSARPIRTFPPRGVIYDRNYFPLVDNRPLYDMKMISHDITNEINYKLLEKHTGVNKNNIDSVIYLSYKIPGGKFKPLLLKRSINFQTKAILEESKLDLNGIYFSELPARVYTSNCQLTHVLGYLRQIDKDKLYNSDYQINDIIGYSGIEKVYESDLKGSIVIGVFIGKQIRDKFHFAEIWRHFVTEIVKEKNIYCIIYDGAIDTHVFKNHMKYHSTLDGLKVYKINNFIMDNPDAYPNIIANPCR